MTDESVRPDVVDAILASLTTMDPGKLDKLTESGVTPAEHGRAMDLFLSMEVASQDYRDRQVEVWKVLISGRYDSPPSWAQIFDDLTPERVDRLHELYDALPDGARAEFDRRYER